MTYDRHFGADAAFEMLADAVRVAGEIEASEAIAQLRRMPCAALLGIYDRVYFGRALLVVLDLDRALAAAVAAGMGRAVDRAIVAAETGEAPFDMATQAAFLLAPLAALDGTAHAARAAETLAAAHAGQSRTLREVAHALGAGAGPATRAALERLAASPFEPVRQDALDSLARRKGV